MKFNYAPFAWTALVVMLWAPVTGIAQTGLPGLSNIPKVEHLPPTPQAASLGKYGQVPVSHQTGVPGISIPLYEFKVNDFIYPISISYHAGGIKVDDVATNVGLGWSLNAGGSISTTLKSNQNLDAPDSSWTPPGSFGIDPCVYLDNAPVEYQTTKLWVENPLTYNFEPQIYNYNFGNHSGRFIFKPGTPDISTIGTLIVIHQAVLFPQKDLKIYWVTDPANQSQFYVAIDGQGVKYLFRQTETTSMNTICVPGSMNVQYPTENLSYVISSIETPNGHTLNFTYRNETYTYVAGKTQTATKPQGTMAGCSVEVSGTECTNTMAVNTRLVESIASSDGQKIDFIYTVDRTDLIGSKQLNGIKFFNDITLNSTVPDKEFVLSYAYVSSRLMLQSIYSKSGTKQLPPHTFQYEGGLPNRLTNDQDYFGFYNGAGNGQRFIPLQAGITITGVIYYGANREVSSVYGKVGTLNKITYPTGGWTEFDYEVKGTGGLQVRTVKDFDSDAILTNERQFTYGGTSSSISIGSYLTTYSAIQILDPSDQGCPIGSCSYYQLTSYPQTQDAINSNGGNTWTEEVIGNPVRGYAGKTRYEYMSTANFQLEPGFNHVTNTYYATDWSFISNLLHREIHYRYVPAGNPQWVPVKSRQYNYEIPRTKQMAFKAAKIEQIESEQRIDVSISCFRCVTAKFLIVRYQYVAAWPRIIEEMDTEYDADGNPSLIRTTYFKDFDLYSLNARKVEYVGSNGKKQIVFRKFPSSYLSSAHQEMVRRNIHPVIEEVVADQESTLVLSGSINDYQLISNKLRLINYYSYESGLPHYYTGGAPMASSPQSPPAFFSNKLTFEGFDSFGNPTQLLKSDGKRFSYLWSSNGRYLHAAIENAQNSTCYHNSFESTGTLAINEPAKTGERYYNADFHLNLSGILANSTLSYWYWDNAKWNYRSVPYNGGAIVLSEGSRIDEVRVTPPGAIMQTFAYNNRGEVISITDGNGNPTYFSYDGFGRLTHAKDLNFNLLKTYQYRYLNEN